MKDWTFTEIPVPADGSCFFSSISIAMNDSMGAWVENENIRIIMAHHWHRYSLLNIEEIHEITPKFVRYMTASAMDAHGLIMHNEETVLFDNKVFETPEELAKHILYSNCWADQSMVRSFMQSLKYQVSLSIFEGIRKKPIYMPREWTTNKTFYILLKVHRSHYTPLRLTHMEDDLGICIERDTMIRLMSNYNTTNSY